MPAIVRMRGVAVLVLLLASMLVLSMFAFAPPADASMTRQERIAKALDIARNQKGDDYNYGSAGPGRFDCSGLVYYSFRKAGFDNIPRSSDQQARWADRIKRKNMKKGDLVFFHRGGNVYHAAIFTGWKDGKRRLIHASSGADRVIRSTPFDNSWFPATLRK